MTSVLFICPEFGMGLNGSGFKSIEGEQTTQDACKSERLRLPIGNEALSWQPVELTWQQGLTAFSQEVLKMQLDA